MSRWHRQVSLAAVAATALAVGACGGGGANGNSGDAASGDGGKEGGTITMLSGTAPQSADSQGDFTTQGNQLYSVVNTPLLTFKRAEGEAGAEIIPGLAESLPQVSEDGKTYTFTLRKGLHYSDGRPITASDFEFAIERAIKINWTAKSFLTGSIAGAEAFDAGKAKDISGITTDDATGRIVVELDNPFGAIVDVLALPGTAPLPQDTPMKPQNSEGVIGDGPYKWSKVQVGRDYQLVKNPKFDVPGLPRGHVDTIDNRINSNVLANAQQVMQNQGDVFDPSDTLPSSILPQAQSQAKDRYEAVSTNSTFYFFLAINQKPFNNLKARQAVLTALDQRALSRLDSGFLAPDCHLIPTGITGHSDPNNCPHPSNGPGDIDKAKQLVEQSGMQGEKVTVWGQGRSPRKQYVDYLTDLLNKIGFTATEKIVNDQTYFQIIGNQKTKPQIGFADWVQDFPNPWDFMQLFITAAIQPQNSSNYGYISDPHVDKMVNRLSQVPASEVQSVASQWSALDQYLVDHAYLAGYGHQKVPKLYSDRLNFGAGIYSVEYQTDLTSLQLK